MPRRVRRALLVALAALAGCSLAAGPDGGACINSCYCHSSGSTAPPEPSPFLRPILASRGPRTLLGAAGIHPAGCFNSCTLLNAIYYSESKSCSTKEDIVVEDKVNEQWNSGIIYVGNYLVGGDDYDPCRGTKKKLRILVLNGYRCPDIHKCADDIFMMDALEGTAIDLRKVNTTTGEERCCAPSGKKML